MQVMEKLKNFSKKFENHGGFCPIIFGIIYKVNLTQVRPLLEYLSLESSNETDGKLGQYCSSDGKLG